MAWLGYTRVSRVGGREHLISPEMQQRRIEAYASGRGLEVEMLPPELDVSGGKRSRPILDAAIERIQRGEAEGLIVATLDRLSRMSMIDALRTIERIESTGGEVVAVAENFDASTPEGRMVRNIHLSIGAAGRERSAEHIAGAKRRAVEHGIWPMPIIPRGYAKGSDRKLIPDPETAPHVRRAFQLRAGGAPWSEVADVLGCGVSGAQRSLANRVYLGVVELRVGEEKVVCPDAHEPLVSRELWEAAQIAHPAPPRSGHVALLQGIVRCASCSRLMSPGDKGYRCFPRGATGNCPEPAQISAHILEPYVEGLALAELARMEVEGRPHGTVEVERAALSEAEDELAMWRDAVKIADVGAEYVGAELRRLAGNVERAREALGRAQAAIQPETTMGGVEAYESLSVMGRRHVLRSAIGAVWVWRGRGVKGRVRVVQAGAEPANLSRPGRPSPPVAVVNEDLAGEVVPLEPEGLGESDGE